MQQNAAAVPPQTAFFAPSEVCETIDLAGFSERAGKRCGVGVSQRDAERSAAHELGQPNVERLHLAAIEAWRRQILARPSPSTREAARLATATLDFLASEWALAAVRGGWDERALFGVYKGPWPEPRARYDAQGLVPGVALSTFSLTIAEITEREAFLTSRTGSRLRHPRKLPGEQYAPRRRSRNPGYPRCAAFRDCIAVDW